MTHRLEADRLSLGYGDRVVVPELSLAVPDAAVTVIIGPNACGKSTLLRGLGRLQAPMSGSVRLDGRPLPDWATRDIARVLGILPQQPVAPDGITVADLVGRGRTPHQGFLRRWTTADADAVTGALTATGTLELAERRVAELSGGQRQRVWIAMALAQQTDILLLDEPTTFLDISHQVDLLDLLADLNRRRGLTVAMVLHDLNLAARYADLLVVMAAGRVVRSGAPADVLDAPTVRDAFDLDCIVVPDPVTGTPMVVPTAPAPVHGPFR